MQTTTLVIVIAGLSLISYYTGRTRAQAYRLDGRLLALPNQYGYLTAMWSAVPAIILLLAWLAFEPGYLNDQVIASLPAATQQLPAEELALLVNNVLLAVGNGGLSPDPVIEDAAAAVAYIHKEISKYGGSPNRVFVSGHSAGGYLTAMVGMDGRYLAKHGVKPVDVAGLMPVEPRLVS